MDLTVKSFTQLSNCKREGSVIDALEMTLNDLIINKKHLIWQKYV